MTGVRKLKPFYKYNLLLIAIILGACNQTSQSDINKVLDARNHAINNKDIAAYEELIADNYRANHYSKEDVVLQMFRLFKRFQVIKMQTQNRHIQMMDDGHALCEQSYTLKVMADGQWRNMVQQEQIELAKQGQVWKIIGGL